MDLERFIRDVPDFPKEGIVFKDITPLLADARAMREVVARLAGKVADCGITKVAGIESRGFLFGTPLAAELSVGFIPIRKPGKLPWKTAKIEYVLEYGTDAIEIHEDAVGTGDRVLIVDDLLATGGTLAAAVELVTGAGAQVPACAVVVELAFLGGRKKVSGPDLHALITYG